MTLCPPSWKRDVHSKIWLRQLMLIYFEHNPGKFHPDPLCNSGAVKREQEEQQLDE